MKYSAQFFSKGMPDWKRKKDPIITRFFYRPVSFWLSARFANIGLTANDVSYLSAILGIVSCSMFLFHNQLSNIFGAVLVNLWLLLDCTDGNMARSQRKMPFGEFADAISSYILVGFLCTSVGVACYFEGGTIVNPRNVLMLVIGAFASNSDTLMRLVYQKFRATKFKVLDDSVEEDERNDHSQVGSLKVRIEAEFGIGGLLPIFLLIAAVFNFLDIFLIYCLFYFSGSALFIITSYIHKARKFEKDSQLSK